MEKVLWGALAIVFSFVFGMHTAMLTCVAGYQSRNYIGMIRIVKDGDEVTEKLVGIYKTKQECELALEESTNKQEIYYCL